MTSGKYRPSFCLHNLALYASIIAKGGKVAGEKKSVEGFQEFLVSTLWYKSTVNDLFLLCRNSH